MELKEQIIASQKIFSGRILQLRVDTVLLPNGASSTREVVEYGGAVGIVALDHDMNLFLVRQFRTPLQQVFLEIPAGRLEQDEDPLHAAQRELEEEIGLTAGTWENIYSYYSTPGFCNEKLSLYLATEISAGQVNPDQDEFLEIVKLPLATAYDFLQLGKITDGKSIIGIQYAYQRFLINR